MWKQKALSWSALYAATCLTLIGLKAAGMIEAPWWVVTLPVSLPAGTAVLISVGIVTWAVWTTIADEWSE